MKHTTSGWGASIALLSTLGSATHDDGDTVTLHTPHTVGAWTKTLYVKEQGLTHTPEVDAWAALHQQIYPQAAHVAVGFAQQPDTSTTKALQKRLSSSAVMTTAALPRLRPLPSGHTAQPISLKGWRDHLDSRDSSLHTQAPQRSELQAAIRRASDNSLSAMVAASSILWLGVYNGKRLAAEVAVHVENNTALIFRILTEHNNRRCGIATHAIANAAHWAMEQGATRWLILAAPESPLGRIASRLGFESTLPAWHLCYEKVPQQSHRLVDLSRVTSMSNTSQHELQNP